eukprot:GFKZ01006915.1.p2 GENE.GFKZ01006915.1~~GFKZ01006915.1.p2  ORF type:complete len:102 (-),score=9.61 GFKZ01006915.1:1309-1614(-)
MLRASRVEPLIVITVHCLVQGMKSIMWSLYSTYSRVDCEDVDKMGGMHLARHRNGGVYYAKAVQLQSILARVLTIITAMRRHVGQVGFRWKAVACVCSGEE